MPPRPRLFHLMSLARHRLQQATDSGVMEEAGLVRRQASDADGRAVRVFATADGLVRTAAVRPVLARLDGRLNADFSEREIAMVGRFLKAVLDRS